MYEPRGLGKRVVGALSLAGAITTGITTHPAVWLTADLLAEAITLIGLILVTTVVLTALYAPEKYSRRAFQILSRRNASISNQAIEDHEKSD